MKTHMPKHKPPTVDGQLNIGRCRGGHDLRCQYQCLVDMSTHPCISTKTEPKLWFCIKIFTFSDPFNMQHKSALCCLYHVSHAATPSCQTRQATAICMHLHMSYNKPTEYVITHSSPCVISLSLTLTALNRLCTAADGANNVESRKNMICWQAKRFPFRHRAVWPAEKKKRGGSGVRGVRRVRDHPHNCRQAERSDGRW